MPNLNVRNPEDCAWDCVALGEVMLRLDPGDRRVRTARTFEVSEGGGEYNVARALAAVFGLRTSVVTSLVDNEVGHLLEGLIRSGGVDTGRVLWRQFDGLGEQSRNGLNFTERGFGTRPAMGVSDRGHTAVSQLAAGEIDWTGIFVEDGARWFHTGGIFAALSPSTAEVTVEAVEAARDAGTIVSYDLNYRPSLWNRSGGASAAIEGNRRVVGSVDVLIGNEEDFTAALGFDVPGADLEHLEVDAFKSMIAKVVKRYPNLKAIGTTLRNAKTASTNDWGAIVWAEGDFYEARHRPDLEIFDRVGGGDGFASGLTYALLSGLDYGDAVNWGATHGALVMTTPGDTSMVSTADVERAMNSAGARVVR